MEKIDTNHVKTLCPAHQWHQRASQGVSRSTDQMASAQAPDSQQKIPSSFDHSHEKDNQIPSIGYAGAQ